MFWSVLGTVFAFLICVGVPVFFFIYFLVQKKGYLKSFLLGVGTFTLFQVIIRIPILQNVLPFQAWYMNLTNFYHPLFHAAFLALTAALFEEVGRFIVMKLCMKKQLRYGDGLAFGLGHGGIEALILVGTSTVTLLLYYAGISPVFYYVGNFSVQAIELMPGESVNMFMGGLERMLTIPVHVAWSVMVLRGIAVGKSRYLFMAILTHFLVDFIIIALHGIYGVSTEMTEALLAVVTVISVVYIIKLRNSFKQKTILN